MNPIVVERGEHNFRAYDATVWNAGADPCLWVHWSPATGRRVEWLGKKTLHQGEVPELGEPAVQTIAIGPEGYKDQGPGRPEPAPMPAPTPPGPAQPVQPVPPPAQLADAVRRAIVRLREIAKVRPAAALMVGQVADDLEKALSGGEGK